MQIFFTFAVISSNFWLLFSFTHDDANIYIDKVLNEKLPVEIVSRRLEPLKLSSVAFQGLTGNGNLTEGSLKHLSSVHRWEDCSVPHWEFANVTFTCFLRFPLLFANYDVHLHIQGREISFQASVDVWDIHVSARLTTSLEENAPHLIGLSVEEMGRVDLYVPEEEEVLKLTLRKGALEGVHRGIQEAFKGALAYSLYKTPVDFVNKDSMLFNKRN